MSEKKRIWLLTIGEYSSYYVGAIFDDEHKKEGEQVAELIGGKIEEEPKLLNVFEHEEVPAGLKFYELTMTSDGSLVDAVKILTPLLRDDGTWRNEHYWLVSGHNSSLVPKHHWWLTVQIYSKNQEHAIKVADEIRVQILSGGKPDKGAIP